MGFLTMSTPPVLHKVTGTCGSYEPDCIGDTQKALLYTALPLLAIGTAGHTVSLPSFLEEQISNVILNLTPRVCLADFFGSFAAFAIGCFAVMGLAYIKPWSLRFGIPAIIILVATLIFLTRSCSYVYVGPQGSHLATVFKVLMAATSKLFRRLPADDKELHGMSDLAKPRTTGLRCLDKAAIVLPDQSVEEQQKTWKLWTISEVEATKFIISLIPMSMSFVFFGLVSSLGYTFFVEQGKHMNRKVGKLTVPLTIFWWFCDQASSYFPKVFSCFFSLVCRKNAQERAPIAGIMMSMLLGILCSITAAKVESRRLDVVKSHGLLDKPDETIPMTVFWLLPQFLLLGALNGMYDMSLQSYYSYYISPTMFKYMLQIGRIGESLGFVGGIVAVYV
ncbi:OLC1v1033737C2 [Oldenlandia corymbosa var. corymbosa]|nr:OLC1v1033737C2 [Oldenlandia corymbosa var. corymbosa]